MTTFYQLFISPMAKYRETAKFTFIAEFTDAELAGRYMGYMRGKRRYSQSDIIVIKTHSAEPDPTGFVDCVCAVTGEYLVLNGVVMD